MIPKPGRIINLILMTVFLSAFLSACSGDSKEVNAWSYVFSIGLDQGVTDKLRLTVQIPTLHGVGGGGSGGMGGSQKGEEQGGVGKYAIISVDCPTLFAGVDLLGTSLSRRINFVHTKFIVVGEEFAKAGIESFVNGMRRARQVRRIMYFIVVKGKASDFIKALNPVLGVELSKFQETMMEQSNEHGLFNYSTYGNFLNELKSTKGQPHCILAGLNNFSRLNPAGGKLKKSGALDYLAGEVPWTGGNQFEFLGTTLFHRDKMVGELDGEETRAMLMASNRFRRAQITIPDPLAPNFFVTADVKPQKRSEVKVNFRKGRPNIQVKVFLEGDLVHIQSTNNFEGEKLLPVLEKAFQKRIKSKLDQTIAKCQKLNCDVFGFGQKAAMFFWTIPEWEKYNWNQRFKDAKVTTEVEFVIRRSGLVLKTNPAQPRRKK